MLGVVFFWQSYESQNTKFSNHCQDGNLLESGLSYAPNTEGLSDVLTQVLTYRRKDPFERKAVNDDAQRTLVDDAVFSADTTFLNRGNFSVPGKGEKPEYCHTPFISHIHESGNHAREMYISCKLSRCPSCAKLWVDNEVYRYAVMIEAYALVTGDRPFRAIGSIPPDLVNDGLTLSMIRNKRRAMKDRLKRQGVTAGFSLDHAFRIKNSVKGAIKDILAIRHSDNSEVSSGALWEFLLTESNLEAINGELGTPFNTWRDCVDLSPHTHFLLFPGNQLITGDKNIVLKKLTVPVYTLDTVKDVVNNMRYLFTHSEVLVNSGNKNRCQPAGVFGDLFKFNPADYLSPDEYLKIKQDVLEVLNENRTTPLIEGKDGDLVFYHEDKEHELDEGYIPLSHFNVYDKVTRESVNAWISSIRDPDNMRYCEYLIECYNAILDSDRPSKMRRLFTDEINAPPDSFKIVRVTNSGGCLK